MKDSPMEFMMVRVEPNLLEEIMNSNGNVLDQLLNKELTHSSFSDSDMSKSIPYSELAVFAENPQHPFCILFSDGNVLMDDYEWNYGPPVFIDEDETANMAHLFTQYLKEADPEWKVGHSLESSAHSEVRMVQQFLLEASQQGKIVILGVQ